MSIFTEEHENVSKEKDPYKLAKYYLDIISQDKIDNN